MPLNGLHRFAFRYTFVILLDHITALRHGYQALLSRMILLAKLSLLCSAAPQCLHQRGNSSIVLEFALYYLASCMLKLCLKCLVLRPENAILGRQRLYCILLDLYGMEVLFYDARQLLWALSLQTPCLHQISIWKYVLANFTYLSICILLEIMTILFLPPGRELTNSLTSSISEQIISLPKVPKKVAL